MKTQTYPISALPLPPSSHTLTANLTPDPQTPSPSAFSKLVAEKPSIQRRSRLLASHAHFSFVQPAPQPFPFRVEPPENGEQIEDQAAYVEKWLAQREALAEADPASQANAGVMKKFVPEKRDFERELIGLSETSLRDCVPHLNVGDAFAVLGVPSLSLASEVNGVDKAEPSEEEKATRQELIDVLSGHAVLRNDEWAPWSLRYSGHQFGVWAGQLGDGRAISVLATPHPHDPTLTYELQLKGGGRTPFSRTADGLAVLRSSIREYLCAEAMHALHIPTTRSLSLVYLPGVPVVRESVENACVLTRVAPSFIRIGNFEALSPPEGVYLFGGGQQEVDFEALRALGEWVVKRVLKLELEEKAWGAELVLEVARRNARMVAAWQAYGFMHGVINTDNVSILGLTIDYGPYAFMDVYDSFHICNHTDNEGRYSYKMQPSMIIYALRALLTALSPLIGAEAELGHAVREGWAASASPEKISEWRKRGMELKDEVERVAQEVCSEEYGRRMRKRLGLHRAEPTDELRLSRPLLQLMEGHALDFHSTFRALCFFRPSVLHDPPALDAFLARVFANTPDPARLDRDRAEADLKEWLQVYTARIEGEKDAWLHAEDGAANGAVNGAVNGTVDGANGHELQGATELDKLRRGEMLLANPRFVLRQWVLEEVIRKVEEDPARGKRILGKVMQMCCSPYQAWGAEGHEGDEEGPDAEVREERRFCGMGEQRLLGFQCSCSS